MSNIHLSKEAKARNEMKWNTRKICYNWKQFIPLLCMCVLVMCCWLLVFMFQNNKTTTIKVMVFITPFMKNMDGTKPTTQTRVICFNTNTHTHMDQFEAIYIMRKSKKLPWDFPHQDFFHHKYTNNWNHILWQMIYGSLVSLYFLLNDGDKL